MLHHLIFEGPELAGKSWLMSQIYKYLEPKYNKSKVILDGCHWFNCDIGIYGTKEGKDIVNKYLEIFNILKNSNLLVEKFHISDAVYNRIYNNQEINYQAAENKLAKLNFKIILTTFPKNKKLIEERIKDRLNLYPHYKNILKNADWYIRQQDEYIKEVKKSNLPYLLMETDKLPDQNQVIKILNWVKEK